MSDAETRAAATPGWGEFARRAGDLTASVEERDDLIQLLAFEVDSTPYAIAVERVREILRIRPITPMPRVSSDVCGVISLRGEIVEVVDMRRRLDLPPAEPARTARIIVVNSDETTVTGILVDAVREVLRVSENAIRAAAGGETGAVESLCVRGNEFISMIDLDRILQIDAEH